MLAGKLADTHGRNRIFQLGLTLFLLASAACGAATSVGALVAARVLQGRVTERLGFEPEGTLKSERCDPDGTRRTTRVYAMTR